MFITLEGVEGAGKSTQARMLGQRLEAEGHRVVLIEEPGGTALGQRVREIVKHARQVTLTPRAEVLLFLASRAQLVDSVIRPELLNGSVVICDRFSDSTFAYQCYGRGLDLPSVRRANAFAVGCLVPNLTVLLDVPPECGLLRKPDRQTANWDRYEQEGIDFHRRVRAGYLQLASQEPARWYVVDALQAPTRVGELVLARVKAALHSSSGEV